MTSIITCRVLFISLHLDLLLWPVASFLQNDVKMGWGFNWQILRITCGSCQFFNIRLLLLLMSHMHTESIRASSRLWWSLNWQFVLLVPILSHALFHLRHVLAERTCTRQLLIQGHHPRTSICLFGACMLLRFEKVVLNWHFLLSSICIFRNWVITLILHLSIPNPLPCRIHLNRPRPQHNMSLLQPQRHLLRRLWPILKIIVYQSSCIARFDSGSTFDAGWLYIAVGVIVLLVVQN